MTHLPRRANLGCGHDYRDGWLNVDVDRGVEADVYHDLDDMPWAFDGPVPDGHFDRVVLDNVLEHLADQYATIRELARVTAAGGTVTVAGPHHNSRGAWVDPTHTRPFHPETFDHPLVDDYFDAEVTAVYRVRFGRLLPQHLALLAADHIGHIVSGFEIQLTRTGTNL